MLHEASLYKQQGECLQCLACLRKCLIGNQQSGFCQTRQNINGKLYALYYGCFSGIRVEPLKSKPFLHFTDPRTSQLYDENELTLSIGGYGCNFQCQGCQNVEVSTIPQNVSGLAIMRTLQEIIDEAKDKKIKIIAFTWNEPAIMPEMVLEIAKLAQANNLHTVYVSNGSLSREHLDLILPFIDAFRYDIKAGPTLGDAFYHNYCNFDIGQTTDKILANIKYTKNQGKHVELLTVLIPGYAPSCARSVLTTARWIKENLGADTPWHLAKFFPAHKLNNPSLKTPDAMIEHYVQLAQSMGLKNVHGVLDKGCDCIKSENQESCCS